MSMVLVILQTDPALIEQLRRMATAQWILTVLVGLVVAMVLGGAALSFAAFKRLGRTLKHLDNLADRWAPKAQPAIDGVTRVAQDATQIADSVRNTVDEVLETVGDVNLRLRQAADAAEQRVREFGAVLDVVKAEAEEVLLDAASTARGVHEAARTLREPAARKPNRLPRSTEETDDVE